MWFCLSITGSCPQDGFYYSTQAAFIECANGLAFEVFCAPGSQNPPAERFMVEMTYTYQSFCGDTAPRTDTAPVSQTTTPGAGLADGIKYNGFFPGKMASNTTASSQVSHKPRPREQAHA